MSGATDNDILSYLALFLGTFVQEGIAIAGGALMIVERGQPPLLVAACLISGVIVGDLGIFGMGALARRYGWLRRLIGEARAADATAWLHRNVLGMIVLSRVVPGFLFPTFLAYGWSGLPFMRFAPLAIMSAAFYTALLLSLFAAFGEAAIPLLGHWMWAGFAIGTLLFVSLIVRLSTRHFTVRSR